MSKTDRGDPETDAIEPPVDPVLGEIVEQITRRLESGEPVDAEDYIRLPPSYAGPLRRLLPTLRILVSLGRSIDRDRPPRRPPAGWPCPTDHVGEDGRGDLLGKQPR